MPQSDTLNKMTPTLSAGDEIRVIAPSGAWQPKRQATYDRAKQRLEALGLVVTYGKNIQAQERFKTGSVAERLADLHDAYRDPKVKLVMALHGGWSANALLPGMDWQLIAANPKPLIGFSDITVLVNALYARTGVTQYLGPTYSTFGGKAAADYTLESFKNGLFGTGPLQLRRSREWQRQRGSGPAKTRPWKILQPGTEQGVLLGGNLGTFYLLQGTPYLPAFDQPTILVVEDDDEAGRHSAVEFDRRFESLLQLPGVRENLRGVLIGRFQPGSRVTMPDVVHIVQRLQLRGVPVIADMDFGHTMPLLTLPIGGTVQITTEGNRPRVNLLQY